MANSLGFLNKPTTPAKTIGPQPKPATATPAPKAFLDKSNPWAVGSTPAPRPAPRTQTPAAKPTPQRANIPSTGYNYTDASYTGATPQQRAREVDQAQMAAQATRQRREREAQQAQAAAQPPQAAAYRPPANQVPMAAIQPQAYLQPVAAAAELAQQAYQPAMQAAQGFVSPLMRRLNSWMTASGQGSVVDPYLRQQQGANAGQQPTPQAPIDPYIAQQQGGSSSAPPATPQRIDPYIAQQQGLAQQAAPAWSLPDWGVPTGTGAPAQPAYNPLPGNTPAQAALTAPTPEAARTAANVAQAAAPATTPATPAAAPTATAGAPLFYGYTAPGPLTIERTAPLQGGQMQPWMTDRPQYTQTGIRAMLSDAQLAAEDTQRQRVAAGNSQTNLSAQGVYRPWASLTDAEKYQRRFGVLPQGGQMTPDNSTGIAARAASDAQHDRLVGEYWKKYAPILGWVDPPLWQYEGAPRTGTSPIQRGPAGAAGRAAAPAPAAPTQATGTIAPPPNGINNVALMLEANPDLSKPNAQTTEQDVTNILQVIARRYRPDLPAEMYTPYGLATLLLEYTPSPEQKPQYDYDLKFVAQIAPPQ